jgi:hypothetical protein
LEKYPTVSETASPSGTYAHGPEECGDEFILNRPTIFQQFIRSIFYFFQFSTAYLVMLAVMTHNGGVILAVFVRPSLPNPLNKFLMLDWISGWRFGWLSIFWGTSHLPLCLRTSVSDSLTHRGIRFPGPPSSNRRIMEFISNK